MTQNEPAGLVAVFVIARRGRELEAYAGAQTVVVWWVPEKTAYAVSVHGGDGFVPVEYFQTVGSSMEHAFQLAREHAQSVLL